MFNNGGEIAGNVFDEAGNQHGFVGDKNGSFTVFDYPGEILGGFMAINPPGVVVGTYLNPQAHGFRRTADGTVTALDFPSAGTGFFQGTFALSINPAGVITGYYND